jgi:Flp pilus assembly pilin Flp
LDLHFWIEMMAMLLNRYAAWLSHLRRHRHAAAAIEYALLAATLIVVTVNAARMMSP